MLHLLFASNSKDCPLSSLSPCLPFTQLHYDLYGGGPPFPLAVFPLSISLAQPILFVSLPPSYPAALRLVWWGPPFPLSAFICFYFPHAPWVFLRIRHPCLFSSPLVETIVGPLVASICVCHTCYDFLPSIACPHIVKPKALIPLICFFVFQPPE